MKIEGSTVFNDLDVFSQAGGRNNALVKSATVFVNDGTLNIEFLHVQQNPMICGIEILSSSGGGPAPAPAPTLNIPLPVPPFQSIYINAGASSSLQGQGGITWQKDEWFNTGSIYTKNSATISGTNDASKGTKDAFLYKSERYDDVLIDPDMIYEIPVPDGELFSFTTPIHGSLALE